MHTPDGSPCGLLNHLSHTCKLITSRLDVSQVPAILSAHGMTQIFASQIDGRPESNVTVQLDGRVLGYASPTRALELAKLLRKLKTEQDRRVPLDMEIGHVPVSKGGQYPGLYLFSDRSRMMRPVTYLENDKRDHVGTFEQVYMDIACTKEEVEKGVSTHVELDPTSMLSVVANMTPYSDFNQSPRNMYQVCQFTRVKLTVSARWESRRWVHLRRPFPSGQTIKWYVPMRP